MRPPAAAEPLGEVLSADPGRRHVARRTGAGIEMLMKPMIGRHKHASVAPINAHLNSGIRKARRVFPQERISTSADHKNMRARAMSMCALVGPDRKLGDMALKGVVGELNLGIAILAAARGSVEQRQRSRVRDQAALVAIASFGGTGNTRRAPALADLVRSAFEKVLLSVVAVSKDKVVIENESGIVEKI